MRGFGDNQAGPRDIGIPTEQPGPKVCPAPPATCPIATGFPIGGDAIFFNTVELRFPLLWPNLTGVVFHDTGNIYSTFSDISLAYHQPSTNPPYQNFNYAVEAPGFGIRYKTPLGPVRVDFAYALNPSSYEGFSRNETIQQIVNCTAAQIGVISTCSASPQRLPHFQFFFSIGQAF
jgi:outer membrane protein assembly factor BamA